MSFKEVLFWGSVETIQYWTGSVVVAMIVSIAFALFFIFRADSKEEAAKQAEKTRVKNLDPNSKEYQEKYMGLKSLIH